MVDLARSPPVATVPTIMQDTTGHAPWPDTSHWSVVAAVARPDSEQGHRALEAFCETFRGPVYAYLRRDGFNPEDAQDLAQEFFLYMLGPTRPLAAYDRDRGRFRPYFLTVLRNFRANRRRHDAAEKRGGGRSALSIDHPTMAGVVEVADRAIPPEIEFNRAWAAALLNRVVNRLTEESARSGRKIPLELLLGQLVEGRSASYRDLAEPYGMTPGALRVAAFRLRERFETLLREEIARTVSTAEEIDEEIRAMFAAFAAAPRP